MKFFLTYIALIFLCANFGTIDSKNHHRHRRESLPPPDALEIRVEGRDVTLKWDFPSQYNNRVQFEIRYRERGTLHWQNVNTRLKEYRVPGLRPGATYEFQVMAVTGQGNRAPSATMEIRIPESSSQIVTRTGSSHATGFVSANASPSYRITPTTMHARVRADKPSDVLLDWDIPEASKPFITGYSVYYSKNPNSLSWAKHDVQGSKPEAAIRGLETDRKYFAKVEIRYRDNLPPVTSNVFEFRTPPVQPIRSVKFSNTHDNQIQLEWFLNIDSRTVARTEILWSKSRDLPESQWQRVYAEGQATTAVLPEQIRTGAIYFVKLFLTTTDGRILRSPTIFEKVQDFQPVLQPNLQTIDYHLKSEVLNHNNLRVSWTFPRAQKQELINTVVSYSDSRSLPENQWRTVTIPRNSATTTLTGLDLRREWWIRIKPVTRSGVLPEMTYRITPVQMNGFQKMRQPNLQTIDYNPKYEVLNHNNLRVSWTFPRAQQQELINTVVSYSDSRSLPENQWRTVTIPRNSATTTLTGLDLRREWWIRIKPVTRSGVLPEMTYRITPVQMNVPQASIGCPIGNSLGVNSAPCTQQRLCLKSCAIARGATTNYECGSDEVCVPSCPHHLMASCSQGWCMSRDLVKSAGAQRVSKRLRRAMQA